ncbi:MAG: hypothetical protein Tp1111SUR522732_54 [Prokaryotic dsDNA virus sp.]|uniref:hypothetical protein n=1 Tax=Methylophaga sp. UBA2689 TaxID=1946878 RepID=UPI00118A802D|nr:hypothetical protein [Methylophaga sp. UBA2689]QDP47116.1 MAG: hypothetical protein Tp1111SUR522732_54 [Prokaryotic dsDNA virus sp.]|tara:strand:- start:197 stop:565 length:369 start_codon:yes stop_codon:yes gene_type:complete
MGCKYLTGDELTLNALKKEFTRISRLAEKAKKDADDYCDAGSEVVACHVELKGIIDSKEHGQSVLDRLEKLKKRNDRAHRLMKKDALKLFDRQYNLDSQRNDLANQISRIQFRLELSGRGQQ